MKRFTPVFCAVGIAACAEGSSEHVVRRTGAVIGGGPSADPETVLVEVLRPTSTVPGGRAARCTGRLVAPGLVLTARHCILKTATDGWSCTAEGAPAGETPPLDLADAAWVTVSIGARVDALTTAKIEKLLVPPAVSLCRADFAYLVLTAREGAAHATYMHRMVTTADTVAVTGWGSQSNDDVKPIAPTTLDALPITNVGPGVVPSGTFTTRGGTLCPGDSGAVAIAKGAVAGVFSHADGEDCTRPENRISFHSLLGYESFVAKAHAEVDDTPRYTEPEPAQTEDASAPSLDASSPTTEPTKESAGCAMASSGPAATPWIALLALVFLRKIRAGCSCASSAGSCPACPSTARARARGERGACAGRSPRR